MRRILLADADAFYVAVARAVDPEGAGRATLLIVGGSRESRGVVCSASYETRKFGVRSAMPIARALRLCPDATCVPVPFKACVQKSGEIRELLQRYSPIVEGASIDEWYLDMTGTEGVYHHEPLAATAERIRAGIREATGLTLSDIPLVGPKFQARLAARGLITVADVLRLDPDTLGKWMSKRETRWLWNRVHGIDDGTVAHRLTNRGISRDETFGKDLLEDEDIERELLRLVTRAAADMRGDGLCARTIAVRLRDWDFKTRSAQRTLPEAVISDRVILRVAHELLTGLRNIRRVPARLVGVRLSGLAAAKATDRIAIAACRTRSIACARSSAPKASCPAALPPRLESRVTPPRQHPVHLRPRPRAAGGLRCGWCYVRILHRHRRRERRVARALECRRRRGLTRARRAAGPALRCGGWRE